MRVDWYVGWVSDVLYHDLDVCVVISIVVVGLVTLFLTSNIHLDIFLVLIKGGLIGVSISVDFGYGCCCIGYCSGSFDVVGEGCGVLVVYFFC